MSEKQFAPKELKTLEIDVEKKKFLINGEEFGDGCTEFTIYCTPNNWHISVEIHTTICFHTDFDSSGKLLESHRYGNICP